jgi:hypothetical protein
VAADLVEEQLQRVGGDGGERGVVDRGGGRVLAAAVVAQVDPAQLQLLVQRTEVVVLELQRLRELVDLGQGQATRLLAPVDQRGDGAARCVTGCGHHCE